MRNNPWPRYSMALLAVMLGSYAQISSAASHAGTVRHGQLEISRAEYLDRARAIWTAQMIGQWTGLLFEHKEASVLKDTPLRAAKGYATVDDDYYYEMVAIRAFEKYGIHLTVEQLGTQWLENNAGSLGLQRTSALVAQAGIKGAGYGQSAL